MVMTEKRLKHSTIEGLRRAGLRAQRLAEAARSTAEREDNEAWRLLAEVRRRNEAAGFPTFEAWLTELGRIGRDEYGIPDYDSAGHWREAYEAGDTPMEAIFEDFSNWSD